jgi:signal transduction histidine kinase
VTGFSESRRWLVGLLGAAFLVDVLVSAVGESRGYVFALPGAAVVLGCVYLGVRWPGVAAVGAGVVLVGSSVVIRATGTVPQWVGIEGLLLSEVLAGGALVVLVAWRARAEVAVPGVAALVISALVAVGIRDRGRFEFSSLGFGLALLVICGTAGLYLRREQGGGSELNALVRRQWPLGAALTVLLLFDIGATGGGVSAFGLDVHRAVPQLVAVAGAMVTAVCAFVAPRFPVRCALIGAGATAVATVLALAFVRSSRDLPFTFTQVAAGMVLVAFVTRYAATQPAVWSVAALVMANLELVVRRRDAVLPLGFLLVISVIAGLYLRARDADRGRTMRVAVTGVRQAERMALARELHDVVAHHVTGIVVAAQAARMVAERDPGVAVGALEKIENSGTEALTAMRMLVGSLRGAEPAGESTAARQATSDLAADIRALVAGFSGPGVHLELSLPETLPVEMGRSVLRVVQESLTNVSKHAAGATSVFVGVTEGHGDLGEELHVFVKDDGTARRSDPAGGSGGYGLIGMRERVELLGGLFGAGPGTEGGWVVKVKLPLRGKH